MKKTKRILSFLLAVVMLTSAFTCVDLSYYADDIAAFAAEVKQDITEISKENQSPNMHNSKCGDNISYYFNESNGELVLTGSGPTYDYNKTDKLSPFSSDYRIKNVKISGNISTIGDYLFYDCINLEHITNLFTITKVGKCAFYSCLQLKDIELPDGLIDLGEYTFGNCYNLKEIVIPSKITTVPRSVCSNCVGLRFAAFDDGVKNISDLAFNNCTNILRIIFPNTLERIGDVKDTYDKGAFNNCKSLVNIEITEYVNYIAKDAFSGCTGIKGIYVNHNEKYNSGLDKLCNAIIETATKTMIIGCQNSTFDYSTEYIGDYAFFGCLGFTDLYLPNHIKGIGNYAFANCENMFSNRLPSNLEYIGNNAFENCKRIYRISLSDKVSSIGNYAFKDCVELSDFNSANGLKHIGNNSFENCKQLQRFVLPNSIESVGDNVFKNCDMLSRVGYRGTLSQFNSVNFGIQDNKIIENSRPKKGEPNDEYLITVKDNSKYLYRNGVLVVDEIYNDGYDE